MGHFLPAGGLQPSPLGDGDEIRLGSVVATFRIPPPAPTTTTSRSGR